MPCFLSAVPWAMTIGQCYLPLLGSESVSHADSVAVQSSIIHFHNLILLVNLDAAKTCCYLQYLELYTSIIWRDLLLELPSSWAIQYFQDTDRFFWGRWKTHVWHKSNPQLNCTSLLQHKGKAEPFKEKADRIWSAEHFIFTITRLKNCIIRERFYHLIFSLQFLVCHFLVGNFFFLGIIRKKVRLGLWKCIFLCIERLIQDYEESESPLLLKCGRKGNNAGSLRAAPSCKLFLWLCHIVQPEILASTFISMLSLDPYIYVYKKIPTVYYHYHTQFKYSRWDWAPSLAPLLHTLKGLCSGTRSWVSLSSSNYWPDLMLLSQWELLMSLKGLWVRIFVHSKSNDALRHPLNFAFKHWHLERSAQKTFELMI